MKVAAIEIRSFGPSRKWLKGLAGSEPVRRETDDFNKQPPREFTRGQAKRDDRRPGFVDPRELPGSPSLVRVDQHGTVWVDPDTCQSSGRDAERRAQTLALLCLIARRLRAERRRRWRDLLPVVREDMDRSALHDWVRAELLAGSDGLLREFFTTGRSFFGSAGDGICAELPQV